MNLSLAGWGSALAIALLALWRVEVAGLAVEAAEKETARVEERLSDSLLRVTEQAVVIDAQAKSLADATHAGRLFMTLSEAIERDGRATRQTLAEIKANDKAVAEYLLGTVPAAYGVQFARPETTDPQAYNAAGAVPPGGVPAAGATASPAQ